MRHLQFHPLAADDRPIFAPVKLERFSRLEDQRNKCAAPNGLLFALPLLFSGPGKGGDTSVGALVAKGDQIRVQLFERAFLLARLIRLRLQPACQSISECIQFAWPIRNL